MRRTLLAIAVSLLTLASVLAGPAPTAGAAGSGTDTLIAQMVEYTNAERNLRGLPTLPRENLGAQAWADHMADVWSLDHDPNAGTVYQAAENIEYTPVSYTTGDGVKLWMDSDGHRRNILNPYATSLDIGITCRGGRMWAVQRFRNGYSTPTPAQYPQVNSQGKGNSCAALPLGPAAVTAAMPQIDAWHAPSGEQVRPIGEWLTSNTGWVTFGFTVTNPNPSAIAVHAVMPCLDTWVAVDPGAKRVVACDAPVPLAWTSYHSVIAAHQIDGALIGIEHAWSFARGPLVEAPTVTHKVVDGWGGSLHTAGWLPAPSGLTSYTVAVSNPNGVNVVAHAVLPCRDEWFLVGPNSTEQLTCQTAASADWVASHTVAVTYGPDGRSQLNLTDGWFFTKR